MNAVVQATPKPLPAASVLVRMATRYGVEPEKMLHTLKETAFKGSVSNEQMMALLVVADQYQLNPWTKEIYAFPAQGGGIVPVVGVDGWSRIINSDPQFDGMDFEEGPLNPQSIPTWIECRMHRKDRSHPICTKEYFDEVKRETGPWKSHPRRMLRHKAMIQCARLAFGFVGIYDEDEGERIIDVTPPPKIDPRGDLSNVDWKLRDQHVEAMKAIIDEHGADEKAVAEKLREHVDTDHDGTGALRQEYELFTAVNDKLAADGVITKQLLKRYLTVPRERT
jgi:phage recombination protein Bet